MDAGQTAAVPVNLWEFMFKEASPAQFTRTGRADVSWCQCQPGGWDVYVRHEWKTRHDMHTGWAMAMSGLRSLTLRWWR